MRLQCHPANLRAINRLSKGGETSHPRRCRSPKAHGAVCKGRLTPVHGGDIPLPYARNPELAGEARPMARAPKPTELTEASEPQIAVHWKEEANYQPSEQFKPQPTIRARRVSDRFSLTN